MPFPPVKSSLTERPESRPLSSLSFRYADAVPGAAEGAGLGAKTLAQSRRHVWAVCLAALSGSFVLGSYGFTRNASTSMFLTEFGASAMPYNMAVVPLVMCLAAWLFNKGLSRFGSLRALLLSFVFFGAALGSALSFIYEQSHWAVAVFDVIVQVFVVVMIEQHWSFFNSVLSERQAKSYNGLILTAFSVGPMITGGLTGVLALKIGSEGIMLTGLLLLLVPALLMAVAYWLIGTSDLPQSERIDYNRTQSSKHTGFSQNIALIKNTPILLLLVMLTLCSQMVAATVACNYNYALEAARHSRDFMTSYMGTIWMYSNVVTLFCQLVAAPFLLRRLQLRTILMLVPALNFVFMLAFLSHQTLALSAFAYAAYKCLDYSLFKAAKEIFYIPHNFDVRYRVKQIIDSLLYRFSNGAAAVGLIALIPLGALVGLHVFAPLVLLTCVAWFVVCLRIPTRGRPD